MVTPAAQALSTLWLRSLGPLPELHFRSHFENKRCLIWDRHPNGIKTPKVTLCHLWAVFARMPGRGLRVSPRGVLKEGPPAGSQAHCFLTALVCPGVSSGLDGIFVELASLPHAPHVIVSSGT